MLAGGGAGGGEELLTVTVVRDEHGYGMKVSGDNPVYVQSVKENGAAWRAGLRAGDRILRVGRVSVASHTHQQVVHMIRTNPTTVLTVQQHTSRHKTPTAPPITAPQPVNLEKQRQLEVSKANTVRLMLEQQHKYIRELKSELLKVPDVRKQTQLESAEQRCAVLQHELDAIIEQQPEAPSTPRLPARKPTEKSPPNTGFLSGLPRSLSNLTGQSLRNLRQSRQSKTQQENQPPLLRQNSDENGRKRHNNTVPMVPTTCLDNTPPPLPPRSIERPRRNPLSPTSPPINPLAMPKPCTSASQIHNQYYKRYDAKLRRSSKSLDGELDGPQPNSIAMQMSYPLVNVPPPPLQTDIRSSVPVLHVRSQSSPEQVETERRGGEAESAPPGTPPPPYVRTSQPCADPQRAIISMEEDDSPASDNSTYSGLFSNVRSVRESKVRMAVLLNWLLGERRCACASLLLIITDGYRSASNVPTATLQRWAYEIQSTFVVPHAALLVPHVDDTITNDIEHVLVNEHEKEEILRNVFRKARQKAKEELGRQLAEFVVKRQVGLGTLYGPDDSVLDKCEVDKAQEQIVVERLLCQRISAVVSGGWGGCPLSSSSHSQPQPAADRHHATLAALVSAALCLQCRPAAVSAAAGGSRAAFLQRDKPYKQRVKHLAKQHPQPFIVRGHHLQLQALTSSGHCHHCEHTIAGLAPQAYVCTDCKLRVHRACAKSVEEGCCLDGEHHNNRLSKLMERIHSNPPNNQDFNDKKSRKSTVATNFLNMERSVRKMEDEQPWDNTLTPASAQERRDESDESLYESADCHSDAISASDDAIPRLITTPTMSKESLKVAVTDEETEVVPRNKKCHRKTMSLSYPLEIVRTFGDEWFDGSKKDADKNSDKKKSRESLWSEEDRDSVHGSTLKLNVDRKNSKKEDKSQSNSRKSSTTDAPKSRKSSKSTVSALNLFRRRKTPTSMKTVEAVAEAVDKLISTDELLHCTRLFLEAEKEHSAMKLEKEQIEHETDSEEEMPTPKPSDHRRRLSRQASRSKSKVRGKSQSVKVHTLRKSHSGTLKKNKKKIKTPLVGRSRQASVVETPVLKTKRSDTARHRSWFEFKGEPRREGSAEECAADADAEPADTPEHHDKENSVRTPGANARGVSRAESCRERELRDAPRRGKHRNASDPNRLTAHNHHDLEPGAPAAPSGSSSSSSLSSRSNESNTVPADQHASASEEWSEEETPLAVAWSDSLPPHVVAALQLDSRRRKRQEVIHELIVSEGSHVRWLKVLGKVFLRPLEGHPGLIPPDELRALFPNLPQVRERHAKLYSELRAAREQAHVVPIGPLAEAVLTTLGEPGYAACLAKFCRGQRMALDALKERRRKHKELHQFLASREQLPLCGRLQLRDLLACVWQRLTKYQLLLEGILKTVCAAGGADGARGADGADGAPCACCPPADVCALRAALATAKDVLHGVDTAIRTAENEHRLRSIQNKLEVRIPSSLSGPEWEEPRRLDLTSRSLRLEGELHVRNDNNKKCPLLGLMLEDCLVLLQREGDKLVLKPITQQQGSLSPVVKWDKVLFRANAAVRNAFFLMNINGVQMHELAAPSPQEYQSWVRHMGELPLAKPELRPTITAAVRALDHDDSGINVSRNPSDASEKSTSSAAADESEQDRASVDRVSDKDRRSLDKEEEKRKSLDREDEERHAYGAGDLSVAGVSPAGPPPGGRLAVAGRICHHPAAPAALLPAAALTVRRAQAEDVATAQTAYTHQECLKRLDASIAHALLAKSALVGELLGVPRGELAHVAELSVAESGGLDVVGETRAGLVSRGEGAGGNMHQLLLAAQAQEDKEPSPISPSHSLAETMSAARVLEQESLDILSELEGDGDIADGEPSADLELESNLSAATLALRLVGVASGLSGSLGLLLGTLPNIEAERQALRRELAALRDQNDALRARTGGFPPSADNSFSKDGAETTLQEQPSNGG